MRELDCDFCGAAAAGTYEVGPAPPDRSPSDRRRLVLCADCRATLADAIRPLLDRLATAEGDDPVEPGGTVGNETPAEGGHRDGTTDPLGGEPAGRTVSDSEGGDGVTTTDRGDTQTGDTGPRTDERVEGDDPTLETDGQTDETTTTDETERDDTGETEPPTDEPPQFRKVVRLLNNRSFPVERGEFVELAASAYDLEESTVTESLAYAVDRGVLAVEDGQIVRG